MPFDWRDFLNLAKELGNYPLTNPLQEAALRSAASRAYYAAFCWAVEYASRNLGFQRSGKAEDHKYLRDILCKSGHPITASKLNKLRQWRNLCDYESNVPNLVPIVRNALTEAEKVIEDCK